MNKILVLLLALLLIGCSEKAQKEAHANLDLRKQYLTERTVVKICPGWNEPVYEWRSKYYTHIGNNNDPWPFDTLVTSPIDKVC